MCFIYSTPGMFLEVLALFMLICYPVIVTMYLIDVEKYQIHKYPYYYHVHKIPLPDPTLSQ
jgi:hypothetical protein